MTMGANKCVEWVVSTGYPNMKLILVQHPGTDSYRIPILSKLRATTGTRNESQIQTPRRICARCVKR